MSGSQVDECAGLRIQAAHDAQRLFAGNLADDVAGTGVTHGDDRGARGAVDTVITNVLTGRPARAFMVRIVRELGPVATGVPSFPIPGYDLFPLSAKAQSQGSADFSGLYAGQAAALAQELPAGELTMKLAASALEHLGRA